MATGQCSGAPKGVSLTPGESAGGKTTAEGGVKAVDPQLPKALAQSACSGWTSELETAPSILEFVVDTSLSMSEQPNASATVTRPQPNQGTGKTKWQTAQGALLTALDGLSGDIAAGMVFFPNRDPYRGNAITKEQLASTCFIPSNAVAVELMGDTGSAQRQLLSRTISGISPNGNTPTYEAYFYSVKQMMDVTKFTGQKYMVLMTDGVPTFGKGCVGNGTENTDNRIPTEPIIGLIEDAAELGIKTFIIGAPGSQDGFGGEDARPWLSAAARAGKTALSGCSDGGPNFCHMDMTQSADFAEALKAGLGTITSQLGGCQYAMPEAPTPDQAVDVSQINVFITDSTGTYLLLPSDKADCTEGWRQVDGNIELCPSSCAKADADVSSSVQILAGCTTEQVIEQLQ